MDYKTYLMGLRAGDTVTLGKGRSRLIIEGREVERVTPKYIHIGGRLYSRETGEATRMKRQPWRISESQ